MGAPAPVPPARTLLALSLCACGSAEARDAPLARKLHVVQGLGLPESVRYDPEQDVYFVSNMVGPGSVKDGRGWTAEPAAIGEPQDSGHVAWRLTLQEHAAGKVDGRGTVRHGTESTAFILTGHRGEDEITLQGELLGAPVKDHGALMGARPMVGEMQMPHDTMHLTLTRD